MSRFVFAFIALVFVVAMTSAAEESDFIVSAEASSLDTSNSFVRVRRSPHHHYHGGHYGGGHYGGGHYGGYYGGYGHGHHHYGHHHHGYGR